MKWWLRAHRDYIWCGCTCIYFTVAMQSVVTVPLPLRQYSGHLIKLHACLHYSRLKPLPLFVTQCCWFVTTSNCTCTKTLWCWHLVYCVRVIFDTRLFLGKIFVVFLPRPFISSSAAKIIWTANLNRPQWLKWKMWGEGTPIFSVYPPAMRARPIRCWCKWIFDAIFQSINQSRFFL